MKKIIEFFLAFFLGIALKFRYDIQIKGLEKLNPETLRKSGGVLFLPNHPTVFVDATSITIALWPKYTLRHLIVEYMYYLPIVNWVMRCLDALPVPSFAESSNSIKRKKTEALIQAVCDGLRHKQNFLIFPAGRTKQTYYEAIDGASAVHKIIQDTPEANIVLVRVKGLWGSSFSRAQTGGPPPFFPTLFHGIKCSLKNLLFFNPRRKVILEFEPAPADFPYHASRMELNKYLENWYNQPDGLTQQTNDHPGDSLVLVSYSIWREELPQLWKPKEGLDASLDLSSIPEWIQKKVLKKISELTNFPIESIQPHMTLTTDLGMDSLDLAEITAFLQDHFEVSLISANDLTSVIKVMALAAKQVEGQGTVEEDFVNFSKWTKPAPHQTVSMPPGESIPEVFLNQCSRMGNAVACGDMRSGIVTYKQLKQRVVILAEYIRHLPGEYIGILLPASVAATMTILACQLAGKIPLMVNWTIGPRHLQAVVDLSKVKVVLSSWAFIDRLQNVDFNGIDDLIVTLEDVRRKIGLKNKLVGFLHSKLNTNRILKLFNPTGIDKNSTAVLLFTSGTESLPKGVPLSHHNILSNQRAALEAIEIYADDLIFGILPPFHSFGFTISSLIGVLSGVKVAYSPDPTDGKRLAQGFERWGVTIFLGAPSFIKGLLKVAEPKQLKTMRLCLSGAEAMPPDLVLAIQQIDKESCLCEGYGITECAPGLTFTRIGRPRIGVGQPLPNVELLVVDLDTFKPLSPMSRGLLLVRGPNVFSGYLKNSTSVSNPFVNVEGKLWYNTGDLGYLDNEGNLIISGRLKRFIKVGGEMISLTALEEALTHFILQKNLSNLTEEGPLLAICGKEIPGEKPKISLYCRFPFQLEEANQALREAGFSNLVKLSAVKQIPEIPLMGSGKINYRKLEEN